MSLINQDWTGPAHGQDLDIEQYPDLWACGISGLVVFMQVTVYGTRGSYPVPIDNDEIRW